MKVPAEGHRSRMRQRAEMMNPESMRPQDLMELLLYYALPRRDTKPQAYELIERFGSVKGAMSAPEQELCQVRGIGKRTAAWLNSLGRLISAYADLEMIDYPWLSSPRAVESYLRSFFRGSRRSEVWQFCLSAGGRLLANARIARKDEWNLATSLRAPFSCALGVMASNVIIAQYADKSQTSFSMDHLKAMQKYAMALHAVEIQLLDVVIIQSKGYLSLRKMKHSSGMKETDQLNPLETYYVSKLFEDDE